MTDTNHTTTTAMNDEADIRAVASVVAMFLCYWYERNRIPRSSRSVRNADVAGGSDRRRTDPDAIATRS